MTSHTGFCSVPKLATSSDHERTTQWLSLRLISLNIRQHAGPILRQIH